MAENDDFVNICMCGLRDLHSMCCHRNDKMIYRYIVAVGWLY